MRLVPMFALLLTGLFAVAGLGSSEEVDVIRIPHGLHFEEEVTCDICHAGVEEAGAVAADLRPDMDTCADCHDVEDDETCGLCHSNVDEAGWEPAPRPFRFDHVVHAEQGMDCAACHGDPVAAEPTIPGKPLCRACHETRPGLTGCGLCHAASMPLVPADHSAGWYETHGLPARQDEDACRRCHAPSDCQECHSGWNPRPRSHGLNFMFDHALAARAGDLECAACHGDPGFCVSCHRAEYVLPRDHGRADWVSPVGGGRHSVEGAFALETCIACHDAGAGEPICAECHGD